MTLRLIEIAAPEKSNDKIRSLAEKYEAIDCWRSPRKGWRDKDEDTRITTRILVEVENQQDLIDALQRAVSKEEDWRITLTAVEATIPKLEKKEKNDTENGGSKKSKLKNLLGGSITREELLNDMENGGRLTSDYILMVVFSTIVAGIGLIESNVAVIIGAMVIAPLLGPNLALAFGTTLGNKELIIESSKTNAIGLGLAILISAAGGLLIPFETISSSNELMARTGINYAGILLALASGAAAVLSLTAGASSALVGVMVAVALMPPAVALGLMIGELEWNNAYGAFLLLLANIASINLAAQGVFWLKGIRPRTWYEEKKSKSAIKTHNIVWISTLMILLVLIWLRSQ